MEPTINLDSGTLSRPVHRWLRTVKVCYLPGPVNSLTEEVIAGLLATFQALGHLVQKTPTDETDLILTTAPFGDPKPWREALLFTGRRRLNLQRLPTILTLINISPGQFETMLEKFGRALAKDIPDPADYDFPGLAPNAYRVLHEQGRRGGPILALERLIQAQAKSIRNLLLVGDGLPERIYHFDLVGAHPYAEYNDPQSFYTDAVLRIVTALSTREITSHEVVGPPIPAAVWQQLSTPKAMLAAARQIGARNFFTDTVVIENLVQVPVFGEAIAEQYSEGCFTTWDPEIEALIATVTGSARPVDKGSISERDLAVITGIRPDGQGALVRHIESRENDPPSSEAVEMRGIDLPLPTITLDPSWGIASRVPVVRSKLHGHRGISSYDPAVVEFIPLDPAYYYYPVSCATEAQANGIIKAFSQAETLLNPADPRELVFTILPGHGVMIAEKWIKGKEPFQAIWENMDAGKLVIDNQIPQGVVEYKPMGDGKMQIHL